MRKIKIRLFLVAVICLILNVKQVNAGTSAVVNIQPGGTSNTGTCSGSWGSNCISNGNAGMRVAIIDKNGKIVGHSVDYWFFYNTGDNYYFPTGGKVLSFKDIDKTKNLKQNIAKYKYSDLKKTNSYSFRTMTDFPDILSGLTNEYSNGVYTGSKQKTPTNVRVANVVSTIVNNRIYYNFKKKWKNQPKKSYINTILSDTDSGLTASTIHDKYYLQFEPLINWENSHAPGDDGSYVFLGTITEYVKFLELSGRKKSGCAWNGDLTKMTDSAAFTGYSCYHAIEVHGVGVSVSKNSTNTIPAGLFARVDSEGWASAKWKTIVSKMIPTADDHRAIGVGFLSLKDLENPGCPSKAENISASNFNAFTNSLKTALGTAWSKDYEWMYSAGDYGFSNVSELKSYIKNNSTCDVPTCAIVCDNLNKSDGTFTNANYNIFISYLGGAGANRTWNIRAKKVLGNNYNVSYTCENMCGKSTCQQVLDNISSSNRTQTVLDKLQSLFTKTYNLLDKDFAESLGESVQCENAEADPDTCNAYHEGSCTGGRVKFGAKSKNGSNYYDSCIKEGFAYVTERDKKIQGSKNDPYSELNKKGSVYCAEDVIFDFENPNGSEVKAGTLFRWGTLVSNSVIGENKFGTMTINQKCFVENDLSLTNSTILNWQEQDELLDSVNVSIRYNKDSYRLGKKFVSAEFSNSSNTIKEVETTDTSKVFKDYKVTGTVKSFDVTAKYDLIYDDDLTWYASKGSGSTNIQKINYDDLDAKEKNKYVFIGYGIPTYFEQQEGDYNIKLSFSNIGTDGRYDKYLEELNSNGKLTFSDCKFYIKNEMFGNECCNKDTGKPYPGAPSYCTCKGGDDGPKGIDVVFRTVELLKDNSDEVAKAFPGRSGESRKIGKNWQEVLDNGNIYTILRKDVYSDTPQYSIKLNTTNIKKIRELNSSARNAEEDGNKVDPYTYLGLMTGSESNGFIGYKCDSSKGKYGYCVSNFLEYLRSNAGLSGSCMTDRSADINTRLSKGVCDQ